jgi:hypothetical protein
MLLGDLGLSFHADHLYLVADRILIFALWLPAHEVLGGELPGMFKTRSAPRLVACRTFSVKAPLEHRGFTARRMARVTARGVPPRKHKFMQRKG